MSIPDGRPSPVQAGSGGSTPDPDGGGSERPSAFTLWRRAQSEGGTKEQRDRRYTALLREYGHIVPKTDPDDDGALPCGWKPGGSRA